MIRLASFCFTLVLFIWLHNSQPRSAHATTIITALPGDTWQTLAWRFSTSAASLREWNGTLNPTQAPPIGAKIEVPSTEQVTGKLVRIRPNTTPTLIALAHNAHFSDLQQPQGWTSVDLFAPTYAPIVIRDDGTRLADAPIGLAQLELSHAPALPGEALALRGRLSANHVVSATLRSTTIEPLAFDTFSADDHLVGLRGTGAFYPVGTQTLDIDIDGLPLWSQPWLFVDGTWEYQDITFTGAAAQIDGTAIANERLRMFALWSQRHPDPFWRSSFQQPIKESDIYARSSGFGARRSYNGGPYSTYHEGVDYAAFEGVPALATSEGIVVLAEELYVRGGAVILDHGLGIYSGYYHLSDITVNVGDIVMAGQQLGGVGTTGLSTGNHLHWDFLVTETWVAADKWVERNLGCWVLEGLAKPCWPTEVPIE